MRFWAAVTTVIVALVGASIVVLPSPTFAATTTIYVSPTGTDSAAGTSSAPTSLVGARAKVRAINAAMTGDIIVQLAGGTYRLSNTFALTALDSGFNGHTVSWQAASGAAPVITGATQVTGWTLQSGGANIYRAPVPSGSATRSLYVDGAVATRAQTSLSRPTFNATGVTTTGTSLNALKSLTAAQLANVELRSIGSFTDRYSGVANLSSDGATIVMDQPAWLNNTRGWDTMASPFKSFGFSAENALAFLDTAGEWFLDTSTNYLYYKPATGVDANNLVIELPKLQTLMTLNGSSADAQAHNITFSGITFTGTNWNEPTTTGGYVDQQTGGYISLTSANYPSSGYADFEYSRPDWVLVPSAVQVAAANNITFTGTTFTGLGASGLGIGNDAKSNATGIGLATQYITVTNSKFNQIGGNAMTIGGIQQDAHHPGTIDNATGTRNSAISDTTVANMTLSNITVSYNTISKTGKLFTSATGILMTYVQNSTIEHNDIVDMPYSGIATGYGWGANDAGGSADYTARGLYTYQPKFTTATTMKNNLIKANYVARISTTHNDSGAIYNLSSNPGTVYLENFVTDSNQADKVWAYYPDEGSGYMSWQRNVSNNTNQGWNHPNQSSSNITNLTGSGNWAAIAPAGRYTGTGDTIYSGAGNWPCAAQSVVYAAGVAVANRTAPDIATRSSTCGGTVTVCSVNVQCQSENGVLTSGAAVATDHPGYAGTGFVANLSTTARSVTSSVTVTSAGTYSLTMRYASGGSSTGDRTATVKVNGVSQTVTFPKTATDWNTWADKVISVTLPVGTTSISVAFATGSPGSINLDYIVLTPTGAILTEAENGTRANGATVASDHAGFSGTGFIANMTSVNRQVTNTMTVPTAKTYSLTLRYSAGPDGPSATVDRTATVTVNGTAQVVTLPKTTSWDEWADKTITVTLPAGTTTVVVAYLSGNTGWFNLDSLMLT